MPRLGRDEWIDAAYAVFQADGLAAVKVEPVARRLGATKGSFYWHFADRRALLDAVIARWEREETEAVMDEVEREPDGPHRLARLLQVIAHRTGERTGERTLYTDAVPLGLAEEVARVTERRVGYVTALLTELGLEAADARRRSVVIVSAVVGYQQLTLGGWDPAAEVAPLVDTLFHAAVGDAEAGDAVARARGRG